MNGISFLLISSGRWEMLKKCINQLYETTKNVNIEQELVLILDGYSAEQISILRNLVINIYPKFDLKLDWSVNRRGALKAWNDALRISKMDFLFPAGDDQWCHNNWLNLALDSHKNKLDGYGVVAVNDLNIPEAAGVFTTLLFDRQFCKDHFNGSITIPKYNYLWVDVELNERAKRVNKLYFCRESIVEHLHSSNNKRPMDNIDKEKVDSNWQEIDRQIFEDRKLRGFPDDWERII